MPAKPRILVAEDNELVRSLMSTLLLGSGYSIVEAIDGEDALQKCTDSAFDLLLMDHHMPKMSGWEACAEIRRRKPHLKVLMLSGSLHQAESSDVHVKFLPKPFENHELLSAVGEMLNGQIQTRT